MNKTLIYTIAMFMILGFVSAEGSRYEYENIYENAPESLSSYKQVPIRFGTVFLVPMNFPIPRGYRMLTIREA
jgi:hypothetical protein